MQDWLRPSVQSESSAVVKEPIVLMYDSWTVAMRGTCSRRSVWLPAISNAGDFGYHGEA